MRDITLGETIYHAFTTRAFATGIPTQLAGSPVLSVKESANATPITAGVSVTIDAASVTGLNEAIIVATSGNGYEAAKSYAIYISTGTVGGVSVVGEVVGQFTIQASAATTKLGTPAGASVSADILAIDNLVDDLETRLGTPSDLGSGATVAANLVDIEGQTDDIGVAGAGLTAVAPLVWDVDATTHQTQGTFGQAIGDPVADTNTIYKAVVSDATGATVGVDVVAIKAETVSIQADTDNIQTRLPAALVGGRIDASVGAIAAGAITAASIATDAIDADALAADAVTEIQTGLATSAALATVQADTDDIQTRLPAALTAGGNMKTDTLYMLGAVWIDTGAGAAGTTDYVNGTMTNPNSSMANARTIADSVNLTNFIVRNGSSITLDQGYSGFNFYGDKWTLALANRLITNSHFQGADVSGLSTGTGVEFHDCIIGTATVANDSKFDRCGFSSTLTLQAAGNFIFTDCFTATTAGTDAVIDFGALGATTVAIRGYAGGLEVRNMAAGDVLTFIGNGRLTIAASCTAGTVLIAGNVNLVNGGSGQTVTDTARFNEDQNITNVTGTINGLTALALGDFFDTDSLTTYGAAIAGSVVKEIADNAGGSSLTVQDVVDGVWNEDATAHQTQGTFGQTIGDSAADANTIYGAVVTGAAGATIAADIIAIQADTDNIQTRIPAALVGGRMDSSVGAVAAAAITAASIATNAIDADALAADAVAEIADGVWDEAIAGHLGAGSTGAALNAAGSAGDPWTTPLPGAYGAGTAGFIIGTNVDTPISSRLAPTVAGRTLDVSAAGEAGLDWANIGSPTTAHNFSATNIDVDQVVASVTGAVGSVAAGGITAASIATNAIDADALAADAVTEIQAGLATSAALATVQADTDDIQTRLPAALVGGRMDSSVGAMAAGTVTAAVIATDAIDADAIAADGANEIADALLARPLSSAAGALNERTVRAALRFNRNKFEIVGGVLTVYKEDDVTVAWTATITQTAGDPVSASDPA